MKKNTKKTMSTKKYISILLVAFVFFNVMGYALISSSIKWQSAPVEDLGVWDISFKNVEVEDGSVEAIVPAAINESGDAVNYIVDLINIDDYYSFKVDIVNDGDYDAKVDSIFKSSLTAEQQKFVDYNVIYENGSFVTQNDVLAAGESDTVIVSVKYKEGININELSLDLAEMDLSFSINYIQKK